ncbi:MAG: VOC family protein [Thiobacillus sp.]|nr:VOC family protein [Thiobacillus sp.]
MQIDSIDHLVLTVRSLPDSIAFYTRVLGMQAACFGDDRQAVLFGRSKLNLHQAGNEFEPKARHPVPGSVDLCLISHTPMAEILAHLTAQHVAVETGPVERTGAQGALLSVYVRDPDHNLIELSNPL